MNKETQEPGDATTPQYNATQAVYEPLSQEIQQWKKIASTTDAKFQSAFASIADGEVLATIKTKYDEAKKAIDTAIDELEQHVNTIKQKV